MPSRSAASGPVKVGIVGNLLFLSADNPAWNRPEPSLACVCYSNFLVLLLASWTDTVGCTFSFEKIEPPAVSTPLFASLLRKTFSASLAILAPDAP